MESSKALDSDFTAGKREVVLTSGALPASYEVKVQKTVRITGTDNIGDLKLFLSLQPSIDAACEEIAKRYERYSIDNANLWVQTASPLGTSSGGFQLAHIPDPENANLPAADPANATKAVRQQGSSFIRPRDSVAFPIPLQGQLYTKQAGSQRWWSFGAIVGVVRAVPDATDYVEFTCTFTATFRFMRTAEVDNNQRVAFRTLISEATVEEGRLRLRTTAPVPGRRGTVTLPRPAAVEVRDRSARGVIVSHSRTATFDCIIEGQCATSVRDDFVALHTPLTNSTCLFQLQRTFYCQ